jgi:hypothetical protein
LSNIRAGTISGVNGTDPVTLTKQSAAKAWVNMNGTGTIAIRDSFNVSSLTDGATGDYLSNFSSNMASNNYPSSVNTGGASVVIASGREGNSSTFGQNIAWVRTGSRNGNSQAWVDSEMMSVTVHGDLA